MSKDNVALFVKMTAEKRDLNNKASQDRSTARWVQLGKDVGLQFNENDLVGFVSEMIGKKVDNKNAVSEFLTAMAGTEMSDAQLEQVAGGTARGESSSASINYTRALNTTLVQNGYQPGGGAAGQFVSFPPDTSKAQQGGFGQSGGG